MYRYPHAEQLPDFFQFKIIHEQHFGSAASAHDSPAPRFKAEINIKVGQSAL
jgi:hypothetical protein